MPRALIDQLLPYYDVAEHHGITVDAPAAEVYEALGRVDLSRSRTITRLLALRGMSGFVRRSGSATLTLEELARAGFVPLAEEPGRELVLGLIGRFWRPSGGLVSFNPGGFGAYEQPGLAKAAWSFRVEPRGSGTAFLSTETRVQATSAGARRLLKAYWLVIRPFSGMIRARMLELVKAEAERG